MLQIRADQLRVFERAAAESYVLEIVEHCRGFAPELCATLHRDQLVEAVRYGIEQARQSGLDQRGPVRLYVDLMIVFGAGFLRDPQYPWIAETLAAPGSQLDRTEALCARAEVYLARVDGEGNRYALAALRELARRVRLGLQLSHERFQDDLLEWMIEVHPRKVTETGPDLLRELIERGRERALQQRGFRDARSQALWVALMFAFGHAFDSDPFLPWIQRSFSSRRAAGDPGFAAQRLERRALIWLQAVLRNSSDRP
jgi:hypothetical protein